MKHALPVLLAIATTATIVGAVVLSLNDSSPGSEIEILPPDTVTESSDEIDEIKVHISGAVRSPGVYAVTDGARLIDAVQAAGGQTEDAILDAVNLAALLEDEDHWHIPAEGEEGALNSTNPVQDGKIDLNTATVEQLALLPGIGPVKATSIVSHRNANGPFSSVEGLLAVSGIGPVTLEGLRDLVVVR